MPRPRVSAENLEAALAFAKMVSTTQGADSTSFVARHGPCSMYTALGQCHPGIIRDRMRTSNRKGVSDAEFLRVLAEEGSFVRFRDRKAVKMESDPTGAGMCMFKGRRWRDPRDATDLKFLRERHHILCAKYPLFANVPFERLAATLRSIVVAWEKANANGPFSRREFDASASSSSTCYNTPRSTSTASSPCSDLDDAVQPWSHSLVSCTGKRRLPECSMDDPSDVELVRDHKVGRSVMHWMTAAHPMASVCASGDGPGGATRAPPLPSESGLQSLGNVSLSATEEVPRDAQKVQPADAGALGNNMTQNPKDSECVVPNLQQDLWEMSPFHNQKLLMDECHVAWFVDPPCEDDFDVDPTRRDIHGEEHNLLPLPLR
jgi:hypothetical protein